METKRSKYDTNPLDGDVAKRADDDWGAVRSGAPTEEVKGATRDVGRTANEAARQDPTADAPTRRFEDPQTPYLSRERVMWRRRAYGDYDHLARVKEWSPSGGAAEDEAP